MPAWVGDVRNQYTDGDIYAICTNCSDCSDYLTCKIGKVFGPVKDNAGVLEKICGRVVPIMPTRDKKDGLGEPSYKTTVERDEFYRRELYFFDRRPKIGFTSRGSSGFFTRFS